MSFGAGLCAAVILVTSGTDADARRRKASHVYSPPYAAIVVDANSGRVLHAKNPDALRFPASITKVMTLYLLFEQLERGNLSLSSPVVFSTNASRQAPSKLGLRRGQSISVEQAILALVTKSANDVAVAVAETIGGTEPAFAALMTSKARALGMNRTRFANASGLPNPHQVTTARDLARLGRAIRSHFPRHYTYFSTRSFHFGGRKMRNHNKLLGRVRGVDGIKTGYTRASGFNLLTSARLGNRHIIAVVLGGKSGRWRDAVMTRLIAANIKRGSSRRTIAAIPKPKGASRGYAAISPQPAPEIPSRARLPAAAPTPPARPAVRPQQAANVSDEPARRPSTDSEPLRLSAYSRVTAPASFGRPAVISGIIRSSDLIPTASIPGAPPRRAVIIDGSTSARAIHAGSGVYGSLTTTPSDLRWARGRNPHRPAPAHAVTKAPLPPARIEQAGQPVRNKLAGVRPAAQDEPVPAKSVRPKAARSGTMIQVGATDDIDKARQLLSRAKAKSRGVLASAKPFTEPVEVRGSTLYRARFAGLTEQTAQRACRTLKRSGFGCFTTKY